MKSLVRPLPIIPTETLLPVLRAVHVADGVNSKHTLREYKQPSSGPGLTGSLQAACTILWAAVSLIFGAWSHLCYGPLPPCPGLSHGNIKGAACLSV